MRIIRTLACALLVLGASACNKDNSQNASSSTQPGNAGGAELQIAVIPKGTTHAYWKTVHAGADDAAKEQNVKIIWKGPVKENDRSDQIAMVQQFVAQQVNGIVIAPLDYDGLAAPIADASAKGIPVVVIDSAVKGTVGKDFVSFVATNNKAAGALGGEELAKLLNNKGKVVLLRYEPGSASTDEREAGFLEAIAKHPDIEIISKDQYGHATQGEAKTTALNMLDKLQQADGIFTPNESTTLGMVGALKQARIAGKVKFVGFDATEPLIEELKAGNVNELIAQNPRKMGYEGVKACAMALRKEPVPQTIDTGTAVITKDNFDTPEMRKIRGLD